MAFLCFSTDGTTCDSNAELAGDILSLSALGVDAVSVLAVMGWGFGAVMAGFTVGIVLGVLKTAIIRSMDSRS